MGLFLASEEIAVSHSCEESSLLFLIHLSLQIGIIGYNSIDATLHNSSLYICKLLQ